MDLETKSLESCLNRLKALCPEGEAAALVRELGEIWGREKSGFENGRRSLEDEIAILRDLSGTKTDEVRMRFLVQEKDRFALKRQLEDGEYELAKLRQKNGDLREANAFLEQANRDLALRAARAGSQRDSSLSALQEDKKYLAEKVETLQEQVTSLFREMSLASEAHRARTLEDQEKMRAEFLDRMTALVTGARRQVLDQEDIFLKGLYAYIQNHVGGLAGSARLLLDRLEAFARAPGNASVFSKLKSGPMKWLEVRRRQVQARRELKLFQETLRQVHDNAVFFQKGLADFSVFIRRQELNPEAVGLSALAGECLSALQADLDAKQISPVRMFPEEDVVVCADRALARDLITEILKNAVEAQGPGGSLEVSVGREGEARGFLRVRDGGPGVPLHLRDKIFQPFFTTKEGHAGLGLTRALRWAALNEGRLECTGDSGGVFVLSLPLPASGNP